jgi:hypothetical protein
MATTTRTKGASKGAAKGKARAKTAAAKPKAEDGASKRAAQKARDEKFTERILEMRANDESWGAIAAELNITSGKAQFLMMLHRVAEGDVPAIRFKAGDDADLVAKTVAAREKQDEFSSWGWLSARTGVSEGTLKSKVAEAGHDVKGTNIAVSRAEKNGGAKKADGKTATQAGRAKKGTATASKAAKAKARARAAKGSASDPS